MSWTNRLTTCQLTPMMEQAEETTGTRVPMTLADAGYYGGSHLDECVRRGQRVAMPEPSRRPVGHPYHKDRFAYDPEGDSYSCPHRQSLPFVGYQSHKWKAHADLSGIWGLYAEHVQPLESVRRPAALDAAWR